MAIARFKELCLDTAAPGVGLGEFWAAVSGGRLEAGVAVDDPGDVVGEHEYQGIAMCRVPEAKTVKHRVHLDVYAAAVDDLVALGASVLLPAEESGFGWTVLADPEGGELCAFLKDPVPAYWVHGIGVDCVDPEAAAAWWGAAYDVTPIRNDGWWTLEGTTPDPVLTMDFMAVPEPKTVKNRLHWDVYGDPADFLARGATHLWDTHGWVTLADPEGNEFCVFEPR